MFISDQNKKRQTTMCQTEAFSARRAFEASAGHKKKRRVEKNISRQSKTERGKEENDAASAVSNQKVIRK